MLRPSLALRRAPKSLEVEGDSLVLIHDHRFIILREARLLRPGDISEDPENLFSMYLFCTKCVPCPTAWELGGSFSLYTHSRHSLLPEVWILWSTYTAAAPLLESSTRISSSYNFAYSDFWQKGVLHGRGDVESLTTSIWVIFVLSFCSLSNFSPWPQFTFAFRDVLTKVLSRKFVTKDIDGALSDWLGINGALFDWPQDRQTLILL